MTRGSRLQAWSIDSGDSEIPLSARARTIPLGCSDEEDKSYLTLAPHFVYFVTCEKKPGSEKDWDSCKHC